VIEATDNGKVTSLFVEGEHCTIVFFNNFLSELIHFVANSAHATPLLNLSLVKLASLANFHAIIAIIFSIASSSLLSYLVENFIVTAINIVFICVASCVCSGCCNGAASTAIFILKSLVCELFCKIKVALFVRICYLIVNSSGCIEVESASELADLFEAIVRRVSLKKLYIPCGGGLLLNGRSKSLVCLEIIHFSSGCCFRS
jgi:hypothetical protein